MNGSLLQVSGINYRLLVPSTASSPAPLLIVYSGVEGGATMTNNLKALAPYTKTGSYIRAVLDKREAYQGQLD